MKTPTDLILISILFFFSQQITVAQQTEYWLDKNDPIQYRKLYLHTDREIYFQGDSIWFKAYYLDGQSQQLINGFYNMYADLVDGNGQTMHSEVFPLINGIAAGNIKIPYSVESGNYLLRAFTDFQKTLGEDTFFHKTLKISKVKSSVELEADNLTNKESKNQKIDVAFLPEGGYLLAGQMNVLGVKVIDVNGKGISIQGDIVNSKGEVTTQFSTWYKGMGKIYFNPQIGETYSVKIIDYPNYNYNFDDIKEDGIKLEFSTKVKDDLLFQATSNSDLFTGKLYYFALMHKGSVLFHQKFTHDNKNSFFKVKSSELPAGINRIVLLDEQFTPISERLFFSRNFEINDLKVSLNQDKYETRTNVQLNVYDENDHSGVSYSNLSVSVVDESAIRDEGSSLNILSYLLLDSELKGNIESPADYFIDEENWSSESKLSLLMLTQGWSRYLWNSIPEKGIATEFKQTAGISIKGKVKRLFGNKPIVNGEIILGIFKDGYSNFIYGKTDANGQFLFDGINFTDTAFIFVQTRNKKGKRSTKVFLDPVFEYNPTVSELYLPSSKIGSKLSLKLYRQKYYSNLAMKEFNPEYGSIMLEEVIVRAQKIEEPDRHFRIYRKPRNSFTITDEDHFHQNIFQYLQQRVSGFVILRIGGRYRLSGAAPLFLIDGMPLPKGPLSIENVMEIPMSMIDKVEVLKRNEAAIFGVNGRGGVVSIFTKKGSKMKYKDPFAKSAIAKKIVGYASHRTFYTSKYTLDNINAERPDNRLTLYWNPNVITQNGMASLSFFTSDDISNFKVFVEGITVEGKICLGMADFSVNEYNSNMIK